MTDETGEIAMLALQGRASRDILGGLVEEGGLPEPLRNELGFATLRLGDGRRALLRAAKVTICAKQHTEFGSAFAVEPGGDDMLDVFDRRGGVKVEGVLDELGLLQ